MKKLFKKTFILLLASLMLISALTACGESTTLLSFIDTGIQGVNLDGFVFELGDATSSEDETIMPYKLNTVLADAALKRFDDIEKSFNCEINRNYIGGIKGSLLAQQIMAAACKYDLLYVGHEQGQLLARGKAVIPAYGYLNMSNYEKYGTQAVQEANAYGGEIYLISPQSWLFTQPASLDIMIFNMEHVTKYGKTDPHEFIENQAWNWDALETVMSDYYVNEGTSPVYSIAFRGFDLLKLLILSNGVEFTYKAADGTIKSDFGQANMLEAIDFFNKIVNENMEKLPLSLAGHIDWGETLDSFVTQQNSMAIITSPSMLYNTISYEIKNYTIMPFPSGPKGVYGDWPAIIEGADGFAVPKTCREPELTFQLIDMICEPLEGFETEESRIAYLSENVVFDPFDAEIALTAHRNGSYSYWKADVGNFGPDLLWRKLSESHNSSKTSNILGQYQDEFALSIEGYMTPNLELSKYYEE